MFPFKQHLVTLVLLTFFSCADNTKNQSINFIKDLTFKTGFSSNNSQIETFNNEEYLCFGDYNTYKKIVLHNLKTNAVEYRIDLSQINRLGQRIAGYEIISPDTVMVLTQYTNTLFFINNHGDIWRKIDFTPYLRKYGEFELCRSATPFLFNDTTLLFSLEYTSDNLPLNERDNFLKYYEKRYESYQLMKVENVFKDSLEIQMGLNNFLSRFTHPNSIALENNCFSFFEDHIIFKSMYTDTLYKIDPQSLTVTEKKRIKSNYTDLYIDPVPLNTPHLSSQTISDNFQSNGHISTVLYDSREAVYYVVVIHKSLKDNEFPWSIITVDQNLNQVNECKMDHQKYAIYHPLLTKSGILVSKLPETENIADKYKQNTYGLFSKFKPKH